MSRRIGTGTAQVSIAEAPPPTKDEYLGRLIKYIPTEIVGLYLFLAGIIPSKTSGPDYDSLWVVFWICLVLTFVYMWRATRSPGGKPLWIQVVIATIAFPIWVAAIGGPFVTLSWYKGYFASALLAIATVVFGWIEPKAGS
jgi:hypothetical protein